MSKMRSQYRRYTRSKAGNVLYFTILTLAGLFSVLPLIYCVITSFKPLDELLIFPPQFFVRRPTWSNYVALPSLLNKLLVPMSRYIFNSLFVALASTFFHIIAASLAAFAFSKSKLKYRKILFLLVQVMLLYNAYTLAVPQYLIFSKLNIIDTYLVYILPAIPSAMGCFLMKQFIDVGVPDALLEAARMDGANVFRVYWQIIMPMVKPAWMTLLLFSFRDMWSIVPAGTVFSEELKTLPQVMSTVTAGGIARTGSSMALTVLLMIPPIIVFMISQSHVIETMSSSGIKE
ncbi:MAG: carbohydrate ABC transporter permease [Ruminococcaceae bacterium]|nr:carbohydrate ABC transporter permease [Oscillospiraceae bacterium]